MFGKGMGMKRPHMGPQMAAATLATVKATGGDADLIGMIKEMQKNDPAGREQWIAYVDQKGGGMRDPTKHTPEFIQAFLEMYMTGGCVQFLVQNDTVGFANMTKEMQRKSESFKISWANYCDMAGGGMHDPMKHPPMFHMEFMDYIARSFLNVNGYGMGCGMGGGVEGMDDGSWDGGGGKGGGGCKGGGGGKGGGGYGKSGKGDGSWGGGGWGDMGGCGGAPSKRSKGDYGDPMKDAYVDRIKAYQRQGQQEKELWWNHCDTNLGGIRDPSRHAASALQEFIDNYGVPEAGSSGGNAAQWNWYPGGSVVAAGSDPAKDQLVARVKAFQRMGQEQKDAWHGFCGPTRDPNRHEVERLEEFCDSVGA